MVVAKAQAVVVTKVRAAVVAEAQAEEPAVTNLSS
jgi:hypothetical protein